MIMAVALVWGIVVVLSFYVWRREGKDGLATAGSTALSSAKSLMLRLVFALLAASFLVQIVPVEFISRSIGADSGFVGIVVAAAIGGFLPGGPMTSFPIALVFQQGGAGLPQMVALISGWSVFALHRLLAYEAPIMGWRFAALRSVSCILVPIMAGLIAQLIVSLFSLI